MMKAGKDLNLLISQKVLGYGVAKQKNGPWVEATPKGTRPLLSYSTEVGAAWEVVEKFGMTLIPIADGSWFAFVGNSNGWASPADFIKFLSDSEFAKAGAAVAETAPLSICLAAVAALEKRGTSAEFESPPSDTQTH